LVPKEDILYFTCIPSFFADDMYALLIRESYASLFELIIYNLLELGKHRMAITGNPGIGKSHFVFYIMWKISTMDGVGTVVLRRAKDGGGDF
jgi:DNA replication protein DnaC